MKPKPNLARRRFLTTGLALGCSAAASPLITPVALAAAPWENRLVVIILRGGMDGLDVVRPFGDAHFAGYRPGIAGEAGETDLDGFFALSPDLAPLVPLWRRGELGFAHAVSTPYRGKRSHFDGQDLLESGTGTDVGVGAIRDGWLNRMLQTVPGVTAESAFAVGREDMIILNGDAPVSSWSPDARLDLSPHGRRLLEFLYHDDPAFRAAGMMAAELAETLDLTRDDAFAEGGSDTSDAMMNAMLNAGRASRARALARFTGQRLNADTRIAAFSIGGWDTHRAQQAGLRRALGEMSDAILTLRETLGVNWARTAVLCMTEFGRTARQNGTQGTDHGTGSAMVLAGGAIRGGRVFGDWPGLGAADLYENRDLRPTGDVRAYAAHAMRGLFGLERGALERHIFPGLDMGDDPRILL